MIKRLLKDNFVKGSSLLFIGMMTGNIFNYIFQITMGRLLTIEIYGEMNSLFSVMVIIGIPFITITNYLAKNVTHYNALGHTKQANDLIIRSYMNVLIGGFILIIMGALFSNYISEYLKIKSILPILLLFIGIFVSLIIPLNMGALQGLHRFKMLSFVSGGLSVFKYIICVVMVLFGLRLNGVMIGLILSTLIIGYISFVPIKRQLSLGREEIQKTLSDSLSFLFILPVFLANLTFSILTQIDLILVKHYFNPLDAGIYSSAAVIGRAVMYLPGAIVLALFPMVASNKARNEGTVNLLIKALLVTLIMSGTGALILYMFPDLVISLFFGKRYGQAAGIVGFFAIAMLPMSIILILINYNLARGKRLFAYLMPLFAVIEVVGIAFFHNTLIDVLKLIFITGVLCVTMLFISLIVEYYRDAIREFRVYVSTGIRRLSGFLSFTIF